MRLNELAIHNLGYCGPSFPDIVFLFSLVYHVVYQFLLLTASCFFFITFYRLSLTELLGNDQQQLKEFSSRFDISL